MSATSTLRRNGIYQRVLQIIRWQILPPLFGISTIVLTASAIYTFVTLAKYRIELSERERKGEFCPEMTDSPALIGHSKLPDVFATSSPCWPTHISVKKGKRYRVILEVVEPWIESENSYQSNWHRFLGGYMASEYRGYDWPTVDERSPFSASYPHIKRVTKRSPNLEHVPCSGAHLRRSFYGRSQWGAVFLRK